MTLQSTLAELGLGKNKGIVYLAILEIGTGSTYEIAKKSNLPRTTVHEILQHLVVLGLISFINKGRTRIYSAEKPNKLKTILQDKERKLEHILPELASRLNTTGIKPRVRFYEGIEGIKTVFEDTLTVKNKTLRGILSMQDLYEIPGEKYMCNYTKRRIEAGIKLKVIRSEVKEIKEVWPSSRRENRELHYATKDIVFPMTMYLYDNKVAIIGTQRENFGMITESSDFYKTQKTFFEVLWQVSKVVKTID